ncbi:hypothetical protein Q5752_003690 [Cryptotrichosporon argae]
MSFSTRGLRAISTAPAVKPPTSRARTTFFVGLILVSLFLAGTVVVLSTVSYYLAIPAAAYLTEQEVPWRPEDAIRRLAHSDQRHAKRRQAARQDWEEIVEELEEEAKEAGGNAAVLGSDAVAEVWVEAADAEGQTPSASAVVANQTGVASVHAASASSSPIEYWREPEWDGTVQGTAGWNRLYNVSTRAGETIPRLIHQTWKSDQLPEKWREAWVECREGMPDYEYMLWTDETAREFVATHYPSQLQMYDTYTYPIQRADSIRYLILHHFGGVYMDLDIGCRRRLDPLLQGDWEVILPITKPVGVSNDLIFSAKGSAFMDDTVHALAAFNHHYFTNYPTVMFSTGPMFLSAQYAIYSAAHPLTDDRPRAQVRILPKSLYGKNAPTGTVPHSFFSHFYGSSWHADDAGFITFLGKWGKNLMYVGVAAVVLAVARLLWVRFAQKNGGQGYALLPAGATFTAHGDTTSPITSSSSFLGPLSPTSDGSNSVPPLPTEFANALRRAGNMILAGPATLLPGPNRRRQRGWLYFVPAMFQPANGAPGGAGGRRQRTASEASQLPLRHVGRYRDNARMPPPPPYSRVSGDGLAPSKPLPPPRPAGSPGQQQHYAYPQPDEQMDEVDAFLKDQGVATVVEEPEEGSWDEWKARD